MNFEILPKSRPRNRRIDKKGIKREQEKYRTYSISNFTSKAVMEAMGSFLTNKYAEGIQIKDTMVDAMLLMK